LSVDQHSSHFINNHLASNTSGDRDVIALFIGVTQCRSNVNVPAVCVSKWCG
jgi:hypothetical protein